MSGDPFAPGLLARLPEAPRKVALLRPSRLGDFICATPALRAARAALPGAEITMITLPVLRDVAVRSSYLDRYVAFPGFPGIAEQFFNARHALAFFAEMQAERFDLALQIYGSGVHANPFTLMLGARWTAGFVRGDWAGRLDAALPIPEVGHEIDRILAFTTFLGAPPQGREAEFPLRRSDYAKAERLLAKATPPLIGLHPGAWSPARTWPPDRLGAAGAAIREELGGTVVVLGGPQEKAWATTACRHAGAPCVDLAGRTSLATLGAVIARLRLLVANDSGPAHVAYALGTPTVTVFGNANPERYGPPESGPHRLVFVGDAPTTHECNPPDRQIEEIAVANVVAAALSLRF